MNEAIAEAIGGGDAGALKRAPLETIETRTKDGATILLRRMSEHPTLRIILSHGNGLAINGYEDHWRHLLPEAELILFDFRNHGLNPRAPASEHNNWRAFVSDMDETLRAIEAHFGKKTTFGAFHSMSALTSLIHTSRHHYPWKGLVLFEPPAVPSFGPERDETIGIHVELGARTRKRRTEFQSPQQLEQSFSRLLMFQRMSDQARLQLATSTLRPNGKGAFELCCPPDFEGDTFCIDQVEPHWEEFSEVRCPVMIVSSNPDDSDMPVLARISRLLAKDFGFEHVEFANAGHMVQLDHPAACAQLTLDFIKRER